MARNPAARASAARDNVDFTDVYRPGSLRRIRSLIPADSLHEIDHRFGISWLEFEHDHWLMDATMEVLGREDAVDCWRRSLANLVERPLLKDFVGAGLRLFADSPTKLIGLIPKGWSLAYRDFCTPSLHVVGERHVEVRFENVAPQAFESEGYLHCWHGVCLGVFDLAKPSNPQLEYEIDRKRALCTASFRWD